MTELHAALAYQMDVPAGSDLPVAVRITDMLGEEILVVEAGPGI